MPQLHDFRRLIGGLFYFAVIAILSRRNYDRAWLYLHDGLVGSIREFKVARFGEIFDHFFGKSQISYEEHKTKDNQNSKF